MRFIHTSDWHIGRTFEREPLAEDQRAFLSWLAGQVAEHGVDAVVVAGDIYDRSLPSEEATALLDEGIDALRAAGAQVVLIPGNHDGATRLAFGADRQRAAGVHVMAGPDVRPWILEAGGEQVAMITVPFLDPYTSPAPRPAADGSRRARTHQSVLEDALDDGRTGLAELRAGHDGPLPSVAVAHAFVSGAEVSDSERTLAVGGTELVDAAVFADFDYVALGHLHRPQIVGRDDTVAYSGSPLPYSFSETHPKSVRLVDLAPDGRTEVTCIPVPVGRPVTTLEGPLQDLLDDPGLADRTEHWVAAVLTDDTIQTQPLERLRARFPHAVSVRYATRERSPDAGTSTAPADVSREPVDAVVFAFLDDVLGDRLTATGRTLVGEAVAEVLREAGR